MDSAIVTGAFTIAGVGLTLASQYAKTRFDARQARIDRWTGGRHEAHIEFLAASSELIDDIRLMAWLHIGRDDGLSPEDARRLAVSADRVATAAAVLELVTSDPAVAAVSDLMLGIGTLRVDLMMKRDVTDSRVDALVTLRTVYLGAARSELGTRD